MAKKNGRPTPQEPYTGRVIPFDPHQIISVNARNVEEAVKLLANETGTPGALARREDILVYTVGRTVVLVKQITDAYVLR